MAVEIIPLGAPDLGMTRAEMLDQVNASFELFGGASEIFFALLFAYVVAMYMAGSQLTRWQYSIANVMYLLVMTNVLYSGFTAVYAAHLWVDYAGLSPGNEWLPYTATALRGVLVVLSIWFGLKVRQPAQEG